MVAGFQVGKREANNSGWLVNKTKIIELLALSNLKADGSECHIFKPIVHNTINIKNSLTINVINFIFIYLCEW